jgi:membrane-bound metal-dependent hydrolase YbcI (DUF457 family)
VDNLTHSLVGITVARIVRVGRGTTATLVLASNAPDIDVVTAAGGALGYLQWHRGPTHGPLGLIVLGIVSAGIIWIGRWTIDRDRWSEYASFASLALIGVFGALGHVLMDLPTPYGTRILSPFDWTWFGVDLMPIIDIYLLTALALGLLAGTFSQATRRRSAVIVLVLMLGNYGLRAYSHARALALAPEAFGDALPPRCEDSDRLDSNSRRIFGLDRWPAPEQPTGDQGGCLVELAAIPGFNSPFRWRVIARLSDAYVIRSINVLERAQRRAGEQSRTASEALHVTNQWTSDAMRAALTNVGQVFLGFSRFPAVHATVLDGEALVQWDDMRFRTRRTVVTPNRTRGSLFTATVRISRHGEVIEQELAP